MEDNNKAAWNLSEHTAYKVAGLRDKASTLILKGDYRQAYFYIKEERFLIVPHLTDKEYDRLEKYELAINKTILSMEKLKDRDSDDEDDDFEYSPSNLKKAKRKQYKLLYNKMKALISESRKCYRNLVYKLGDAYGYGMGRKEDDNDGFD